jgi:O-antigen/teichoic acid export membrane protein
MHTARALAWNTGVQIIGKIISTAIGVVVIGLMARYLGDVRFGFYSTANAFFQVFAILLDLGLNVMLVQLLGEHAGDKAYEQRAVSATYTLRILTSIVVLGVAPLIGLMIPQYPWELKLALFAIFASFLASALNQIVVGVQQRHLAMHVVAIAEVAGRLVLLGGLLLAIHFHLGLIPIVFVVSLGGVVNLAINRLVAGRYASFAWNIDPAFWRILIIRVWPIGVSILFNLIYFKADTLILSWVRPFTEVGIYGAAYRVLEIFITLPFMYTGVLLPLIAQAWIKKDLPHFRALMNQSYTVMVLLVAPIVAGVIALGPRIMTLVAGEQFVASGEVLKILILAAAIIFVGTVSSHAIIALDIQRNMIPAYIGTAIVALTGYWLFIPIYGMWAAAWITVVSEGLVAFASTWIAVRASRIPLPWWAMAKSILAAYLMYLCIQPLAQAPLILPIAVGSASYILLVFLLRIVPWSTVRDLLPQRS